MRPQLGVNAAIAKKPAFCENLMMVRLFLLVQAALFLAFGMHAFFNAPTIADNLGASGISPSGLHELRSNYGGISIAIAILCGWGGWRSGMARPALFFLIFYTGGYALGRVLALSFDGIPDLRFIIFGVYELVTAIIAIWLLIRLEHRHKDSTNDG